MADDEQHEQLLAQWHQARKLWLDLLDILPPKAPEIEMARLLVYQLEMRYRHETKHGILPLPEDR